MAAISKSLRLAVRTRAAGRCEYCRTAEIYCGYELEVDHIMPSSAGGVTTLDNLALACSNCNAHKSARAEATDPQTGQAARLFNPRQDAWRDHFEWGDDGLRILGKTDTGRATVDALHMNNGTVITARAFWVSYGVHPPENL